MNLYISDIDGTLINGDKALTSFAREALSRMLREGLPFTIASARSIVTLREILGDLPFRLPVIEGNGAFITDWSTGRHLLTQAMAPALAADVWRVLRGMGHSPIIVTNDGEADHIYCPPAENPGMTQYYEERRAADDRRMTPFDQSALPPREQVVMFVVIELEARLSEAAAELARLHGDDIHMHLMENLYHREWNWLTIHDPRATKGHAVQILKERFAPDARRIVVFGDHSNDISLFEAADHGVAVGNATDDLKNYADEIIGPHTEDAVVRYLMERWNNSEAGGDL